MSKWEIVRRPELESHNGAGTDPARDWRRYVLEQVGYDEHERDRIEQRALRLLTVRDFGRGLLRGLILYALAFATTCSALYWRAGRLDRFLPKRVEPMEVPQPVRLPDPLPEGPAARDANLASPFDVSVPAAARPTGADERDAGTAEDDTAGSGD